MKNRGSKFELEQERNEDLMRAYREQLEACDHIRMPEVYARVVDSPSVRFWVSEERASIVIARMFRGDSLDEMRPLKREMFREIYSRVLALKRQQPGLSIVEMVRRVLQQPAPKFYLTPGTAKVFICKIRKEWYYKRLKRRLRHLF